MHIVVKKLLAFLLFSFLLFSFLVCIVKSKGKAIKKKKRFFLNSNICSYRNRWKCSKIKWKEKWRAVEKKRVKHKAETKDVGSIKVGTVTEKGLEKSDRKKKERKKKEINDGALKEGQLLIEENCNSSKCNLKGNNGSAKVEKHYVALSNVEHECGMSIELLKKNEWKVKENMKKRGLNDASLNVIELLKNLIREKGQLEIINNTLRNKKKKLSDQVKALMLLHKCQHGEGEEKGETKKNEVDQGGNNNSEANKEKNMDGSGVNGKGNIEAGTCKHKRDLEKRMQLIQNLKKEIETINEHILLNGMKLAEMQSEKEKQFCKIPNMLLNMVPDGTRNEEDKIVKKSYTYKTKKKGQEKRDSMKTENCVVSHEKIIKRYEPDSCLTNISNKIGFGYNILTNDVAKLERALIDFMIETHTKKFKYFFVKAPLIVPKSALVNTGQLPKFEKELFHISSKKYKILNEDAYLIPTSEVSLLNLYRNSLIDYTKLPIKLISHSSCFRNETSICHGKSTKGLLREYIFEKVELINITDKNNSVSCFKNLISNCEYILKRLHIPYRVVLLNSKNTPVSASICYDIEAWLPSQQKFIEVSSCSNCLDYQSRKLNLKFKKKNGDTFFCHTINGSGLAVGRVLAILLEQYQNAQSLNSWNNREIQINIPHPLRKFMRTSKIYL